MLMIDFQCVHHTAAVAGFIKKTIHILPFLSISLYFYHAWTWVSLLHCSSEVAPTSRSNVVKIQQPDKILGEAFSCRFINACHLLSTYFTVKTDNFMCFPPLSLSSSTYLFSFLHGSQTNAECEEGPHKSCKLNKGNFNVPIR